MADLYFIGKKMKVTHDTNCPEFAEDKKVCRCALDILVTMAQQMIHLENLLKQERADKHGNTKPTKRRYTPAGS